ncbi:hypothetical protein Golax_021243, partial [Gossypium laxum]|nr:hypothetical protein [Gossypium laxum]
MSFFKQFYDSVTKSDYLALREGFIRVKSGVTDYLFSPQTQGHRNFDFHGYMIRTLEVDFKKILVPVAICGGVFAIERGSVMVQVLCSYSTLPLYALVTLSSLDKWFTERKGEASKHESTNTTQMDRMVKESYQSMPTGMSIAGETTLSITV